MRLSSGATGFGQGAMAHTEAHLENVQGGWTIAGASGEGAQAWAEIQGGRGDVLTTAFEVNGRRVALAVAIGSEPHQLPRSETATLLGRAAVRRR